MKAAFSALSLLITISLILFMITKSGLLNFGTKLKPLPASQESSPETLTQDDLDTGIIDLTAPTNIDELQEEKQRTQDQLNSILNQLESSTE